MRGVVSITSIPKLTRRITGELAVINSLRRRNFAISEEEEGETLRMAA